MPTRILGRCRGECVLVACIACAPPMHDNGGLASACGEASPAPSLVLVDSVPLVESDTTFIGNPAVTFTVGPDGRFHIPDRGSNRILQFSARGEFLGVAGGHGGGPGEFRSIGYVGLMSSGRLWQNDYSLRRLSGYDSAGNPVRDIPYAGRLSHLNEGRHGIWAGLADHALGLAVGTFDSLLGEDSLVASIVTLPAEYRDYPLLRYWDEVRVVESADGIVVGFGGLDYLVTYDINGHPTDTVWIPACRRHGSPRPVLEAGFRHPPRNAEEERRTMEYETQISTLLGLWRLSDGQILTWYQDSWRDEARIIRSTAYLSLLSPDLKRACVDAPLTGVESKKAILAVRDDKVHQLDQVVGGPGTGAQVRTVIRRYALDTTNCDWLPTTRRPS